MLSEITDLTTLFVHALANDPAFLTLTQNEGVDKLTLDKILKNYAKKEKSPKFEAYLLKLCSLADTYIKENYRV